MKSELQTRAERAAELFTTQARKPIVVEFAGVPKAGKTTTLTALQAFLRRCGFRVEVVVERASVCPVRDKKHSNFNVWTACTTLAQILEKTQDPPRADDPHVLILDRGLFDSICWLRMMQELARIRRADREAIEAFLRLDDWRKRVTAVFLMVAGPEDAMEREKGYPPVEGAQGSIMNKPVLEKVLKVNLETAEKLSSEFRIFRVDTSSGEMRNNARNAAQYVVETTLGLIEEQIEEQILYVPKSVVSTMFSGRRHVDADAAEALRRHFTQHGAFGPRAEVEARPDRVQALPVVVVRNKSGDVLQLRRRERSEDNVLHRRIVIWAGGHVRQEDGSNGDSILAAAVRELREELRLDIERDGLKLLGAVYIDEGGSTAKHVAIVYEWKASSDDVAVALSSSEFYERRGTSLSGSFIERKDLVTEVDAAKVDEVWSVEIVRALLPEGAGTKTLELF